MTMDVRLYILAGTFALMVVSLITVVLVAARVRRRGKPLGPEEYPATAPVPMDEMSPVDADLAGLEVPVPENSPHAALLTPLAEKPVWEESFPPHRGAEEPPRSGAQSTQSSESAAPAAKALSLSASEGTAAVRPPVTPPVTVPASPTVAPPAQVSELSEAASDLREGPGRVPQVGPRETHRLPSADEILASLEAEMARQEQDGVRRVPMSAEPKQPATVERTTPSARPVRAAAASEDRVPPAAPSPRTSSAAGVPAEQVQWRPEVAKPAEPLAAPEPPPAEVPAVAPGPPPPPEAPAAAPEPPPAAPIVAVSSPIASAPVPEAPASQAPVIEPARRSEVAPSDPGRPVTVVRAAEPPARIELPQAAAPLPTEPRPAVRVAGIRVPLAAGDEPGTDDPTPGEPEDVPEIELSSPVEMWFGEHRIGVRQGTPTYDRLQRYAETLLSDLRESRDEG
jgi:hypothetical protein